MLLVITQILFIGTVLLVVVIAGLQGIFYSNCGSNKKMKLQFNSSDDYTCDRVQYLR